MTRARWLLVVLYAAGSLAAQSLDDRLAVLAQRVTDQLAAGKLRDAFGSADMAIRIAPRRAIGWQLKGRCHRLRHAEQRAPDLDAALNCYQRACEVEPGSATAWLELAELLLELDRPADALPAATRAVERDEGAWAAHYALGRCLSRLGRYEEATEPLRRAIRLAPHRTECYPPLAVALLEIDRLDEAAEILEKAVHQGEADPRLYLAWIDLLCRRGGPSASDAAIAEALRRGLNQVALREGAAERFEALGHDDAATAQYEALLAAGRRDSALQVRYAALLARIGRPEAAEARLRSAVAAAPDEPAPRVALARLLADLDRPDEAAGAFAAACARRPRDAELWLEQADFLRRLGRGDEAEAAFRRAVQLRPDDHEIRLAHLRFLVQSERLADADAEYRRLIEAWRRRYDAWFIAGLHRSYGDILAARGFPEPALEAYRAALELEPDEPVHREQYADALVRCRRAAEAEPEYRRLLDSAPDDARLWLKYAAATARQGDQERADNAFRRALELRPDDLAARLAHAEFLLETERRDDAVAATRAVGAKLTELNDLLSLAYDLAFQNRHAEADALFADAVGRWPEEPYSRINRAWYLTQRARPREAGALFAEVCAAAPDQPGPWFEQARFLARLDAVDEAAASFQRALELAPTWADGLAAWADELDRRGETAAAEEAYRRVVHLDPGRPPRLLALAEFLDRRGRPAEAEVVLREALTLAGPAPTGLGYQRPPWLAMIAFLRRHGRPAEIQPLLAAAQAAGVVDPALFWEQAGEWVATGDTAALDRFYRRQLAAEPTSTYHPLHYAALLAASGRAAAAEAVYRELMDRPSPHLPAWWDYAALLTRVGRLDEAERALRRAVAIDESNDLARLRLADWLLARGRPVDAASEYQEARLLRPRGVPAAVGLGRCLALLRHAAEADQALADAVAAEPLNPELRLLQARALLDAGRPQQAEATLREATARQPRETVLSAAWVRLLLAQRQPDQAAATLAAAQARTPGDPELLLTAAVTDAQGGLIEEAAARLADLAGARPETWRDRLRLITLAGDHEVAWQVIARLESRQPAEALIAAVAALAAAEPGAADRLAVVGGPLPVELRDLRRAAEALAAARADRRDEATAHLAELPPTVLALEPDSLVDRATAWVAGRAWSALGAGDTAAAYESWLFAVTPADERALSAWLGRPALPVPTVRPLGPEPPRGAPAP